MCALNRFVSQLMTRDAKSARQMIGEHRFTTPPTNTPKWEFGHQAWKPKTTDRDYFQMKNYVTGVEFNLNKAPECDRTHAPRLARPARTASDWSCSAL